MTPEYSLSIRCYFGGDPSNFTQHYQTMKAKDIAKWIEAYRFTHPNVQAITVKLWFNEEESK